jgi:hypothetical protein
VRIHIDRGYEKPERFQGHLREGAIRRTLRDIHIAEEWASLEDTLLPEEERLVQKGKAQLKRGQYVGWEGLKNI